MGCSEAWEGEYYILNKSWYSRPGGDSWSQLCGHDLRMGSSAMMNAMPEL